MVRGRLAGELRARGLGRGERLDRLARREVLDVRAGVLEEAERPVAGDHRRLRDRGHAGEAERGRDRALVHHPVAAQLRVLLVQQDRAADEVLVLEGAAHDPGRGDRQAVVGEPDRARLADRRHLGQLLTPHPPGDGADEARGHGRLGAGPLPQREHVRRRRRPPGRCWPSRRSRSSRRPRRRGCRSRGPPCAPGPASAGARGGRRRRGRRGGRSRRSPRRRRAPPRRHHRRSRRSARRGRRGRRHGRGPTPGPARGPRGSAGRPARRRRRASRARRSELMRAPRSGTAGAAGRRARAAHPGGDRPSPRAPRRGRPCGPGGRSRPAP